MKPEESVGFINPEYVDIEPSLEISIETEWTTKKYGGNDPAFCKKVWD